MKIVIIGSGPTALGAAYRLYETGALRSGHKIILLEQSNKVGGLSVSERDDNGFLWDMGGHVVFSHYYYFDLVLDKMVSKWNERSRSSYVFMKGSSGKRKFIPYPIQHNIQEMDDEDQQSALDGLEKLSSTSHPSNFAEWLNMNFGTGLCELFMTKYNKKVWTVDPEEMNSQWVGERVAVPNIEEIKRKIEFPDNNKNDSGWGPNKTFRFPKYGGTQTIWSSIYESLPKSWFVFNSQVVSINSKLKKISIIPNGNIDDKYDLYYDHLISTQPLDLLLKTIVPTCVDEQKICDLAPQFIYSSTHVIGIGLEGSVPDYLKEKTWMYFPDDDSPFYRITVFSNYSSDHTPDPSKYWSLMCECAEPKNSENKDKWSKQQIIDKTIKALIEYEFIGKDQIVSTYHRRLDHGYPTPFLKREELLKKIQPWLESRNIWSRGRFGGWRYEVSNQDHSFMQGVEAADRVVFGIPEETYDHPPRVNTVKGPGKFFSIDIDKDPEYEYVIAHYNEDLDWTKSFADHCHIYHKGNELRPRYEYLQWEKLPNVGREAHTYLHHIVTHYHKLAEITVFLQGKIQDHIDMGHSYGHPLDYVNETHKHEVGFSHRYIYNNWGRIQHNNKYLIELNEGKMKQSKYDFANFWRFIFNTEHPIVILMNYGACFGVSRKRIHRHPLEFYQKLLGFLDDHINPEEGHYMERLWMTIFC